MPESGKLYTCVAAETAAFSAINRNYNKLVMSTRVHELAALVVLLVACGGAVTHAQGLINHSQIDVDVLLREPFPSAFVPASDAGFVYTEFVNANFDGSGVDFDRLTVPWFGALHSPGTRVSFRTDAHRIELHVSYLDVFSAVGAGIFRLEIDGVLQPWFIGSDNDVGDQIYLLANHRDRGTHEYSLIMPYGSDVVFAGIQLTGGSGDLNGSPPSRPRFHYVAYGDSITHGFEATSAASSYPFRVGLLRNWSVTNMGFIARTVSPEDGTAVGSLGADCVSVAIGVNDYWDPMPTPLATFKTIYDDFLTNIRAEQPNVPLFVITPTWVAAEGNLNSLGLTVESYRAEIRGIVLRKMDTDSQIFLIDGLSLVPGNLTNFPGGIHPSDVGFELYAASLDAIYTGVFGAPNASSIASASPFARPLTANAGIIASRDNSSQMGIDLPGGAASSTMGSRFDKDFMHSPFGHDSGPSGVESRNPAPPFAMHPGGRRGKLGEPTLSVSEPVSGGSGFDVHVGNAAGIPTVAWILFASDQAAFPVLSRGDLSLVEFSKRIELPVGGKKFLVSIPDNSTLGEIVWMQGLQLDPGAPGGLSMTRPCSIRLGSWARDLLSSSNP